MTAPVSRAVLALAVRCLGERRREWALAMRAELDAAIADGRPLAFATGCLVASWREMPQHAEGRLVLSTYALALGVLLPMAVAQVALALGFSSVLFGGEWFDPVLLAGLGHHPVSEGIQLGAAPCLLALWLLLGIGHVRLAWVLVEQDWARMTRVGALIGATIATLFIVMGVLLLDLTYVNLQAAALALELAVLVAVARRCERLFPDAVPETPAP
jgi:hypothetical protein